jgi:hypothetical protein
MLPRSSRVTSTSSDKVASRCTGVALFAIAVSISLQNSLQFASHNLEVCLGIVPLDAIPENADILDLQLDGVSMLEVPSEIDTTSIVDRAGPDEFPCISASYGVTCSMISSKENNIPLVVPQDRVSPLTRTFHGPRSAFT